MKSALTMLALAATTVLLLGPGPAAAGEILYRWKDDRGNPVHSDRPPPKGTDYEVISTDSSMVRSVDGDEGAVPRKLTPNPSNEFQTVDSRVPKVEKNPEYCERAKQNLDTLGSAVKIQMRNDQGELRYLTEEEREVQKEKARQSIRAHCE